MKIWKFSSSDDSTDHLFSNIDNSSLSTTVKQDSEDLLDDDVDTNRISEPKYYYYLELRLGEEIYSGSSTISYDPVSYPFYVYIKKHPLGRVALVRDKWSHEYDKIAIKVKKSKGIGHISVPVFVSKSGDKWIEATTGKELDTELTPNMWPSLLCGANSASYAEMGSYFRTLTPKQQEDYFKGLDELNKLVSVFYNKSVSEIEEAKRNKADNAEYMRKLIGKNNSSSK